MPTCYPISIKYHDGVKFAWLILDLRMCDIAQPAPSKWPERMDGLKIAYPEKPNSNTWMHFIVLLGGLITHSYEHEIQLCV